MGRREGRFRQYLPRHDHRPIVDCHFVKEYIQEAKNHIQAAQHQQFPIHFHQLFALNPLYEAHDGKRGDNSDRKNPADLRNRIDVLVYTNRIMNRLIQMGKANRGSIRPNRRDIHCFYQNHEDYGQHCSRNRNPLFRFCFHR